MNIGGDDLIELAIAHLKASGYRVTKAKTAVERPALNAIGKPYGPNYDPNYRIKYRMPAIKVKAGDSTAASIRSIDEMRAHIAAHWAPVPGLAQAA